ncbi:MAG: hypothetical protein ACMG6S_10510, partial [Byssovorax sp.]
MQSAPSPNDLSEPLLGVLSRYVSTPTAQSIVKLARQRANVTTPRIDRARLGDMLAPIERNLRLFIDDPSRVAECCAAIHTLTEASTAIPAPAPSASSTPVPSSVRFSSAGSGPGSSPSSLSAGPTSVRYAPQAPPSRASSPGGAPTSVRYAPPPPPSRASSPGGAPSSVRLPPVMVPSVSEVVDSDPISVRTPPSVRAPPSARFALIPIRIEDDITRARSESREL